MRNNLWKRTFVLAKVVSDQARLCFGIVGFGVRFFYRSVCAGGKVAYEYVRRQYDVDIFCRSADCF